MSNCELFQTIRTLRGVTGNSRTDPKPHPPTARKLDTRLLPKLSEPKFTRKPAKITAQPVSATSHSDPKTLISIYIYMYI